MLNSSIFKDVIVSSESNEVERIISDYNVTFHHRSPCLSDDKATVVEVCMDVLNYHKSDSFCCIYPTAILVTAENIKQSYKKFISHKANYLMGISEYNYPPYQALTEDKEGFLSARWPELCKQQSQEHPRMFVSNGSIYWARTNQFLLDKTFYGKRLIGYPVTNVDINTQKDFNLLRSQFKQND